MAQYETKLIVKAIAEVVVRTKSPREAYNAIAKIAKDEGLQLPSYDERLKEIKEDE